MRKKTSGEWSQFLAPIQTPTTLADQVYHNLLQAILSQRIPPGQHLVEQLLADQLSVSRISIRDAIRRLAQEGLVESIPARGSFVVNLTPSDVVEVCQLRTSLECVAMEHIIRNFRPDTMDIFESHLAEMRAVEIEEDRLRSAAVDNNFHRSLMHLSGLKRTIQIWEQLSNLITMVIFRINKFYPSTTGLADRHIPLVKFIRSQDAAEATKYLTDHIQEGADNIVKAMNALQE